MRLIPDSWFPPGGTFRESPDLTEPVALDAKQTARWNRRRDRPPPDDPRPRGLRALKVDPFDDYNVLGSVIAHVAALRNATTLADWVARSGASPSTGNTPDRAAQPYFAMRCAHY